MERELKRRKAKRNLLADPEFLAMHTPERRLAFAVEELLVTVQREIDELVAFVEAGDEDPTFELVIEHQMKKLDSLIAKKAALEKVKEAFK